MPLRGKDHPKWNGGHKINKDGYKMVMDYSHPRAVKGYVCEHIIIIEKALGKHFPDKAVTHHSDGDPSNNSNNNLVLCEDQAHHLLLHARKNAHDACGNANWLKCTYCKEYDDPQNMYIFPNRYGGYHKECYNKHRQIRRGKQNGRS